jgi:hypothetical protein
MEHKSSRFIEMIDPQTDCLLLILGEECMIDLVSADVVMQDAMPACCILFRLLNPC